MKIKRARGHRLYTHTGEKILDLSMDGGRAVIGHRPNGLSLTLKNSIERGIYVDNGSEFEGRLKKDLSKRFPKHPYIYLLEHRIFLEHYLKEAVSDPLLGKKGSDRATVWRPFLETPEVEILEVLYPLPGLNTTSVIVSKTALELPSHKISPVLLSGILRSLYDFDMVMKNFSREKYEPFHNLKNVNIIPPYMTLNCSDELYTTLLERSEEVGVLLNPEDKVVILPPDYSKGELNRVIDLFREVLDG